MKKQKLQRLGVQEGVYEYTQREIACVIHNLFAWLPPCQAQDLGKNSVGRLIFQKRGVENRFYDFLQYCILDGKAPLMEPWLVIALRVRLCYAIDFLLRDPDDKLHLTPQALVNHIDGIITLFWQAEGLRWMLLDRAQLPLITH